MAPLSRTRHPSDTSNYYPIPTYSTDRPHSPLPPQLSISIRSPSFNSIPPSPSSSSKLSYASLSPRFKLLIGAFVSAVLVWNLGGLKRGVSASGGKGWSFGRWGDKEGPFSSTERYLNGSNVDVFKDIDIEAVDGSIKATVIPMGGSLTNLWVKDREGVFRDVVLGYDDRLQYYHDPHYASFGPIVGRYANRIRNSTFSIPDTGKTYHVSPNENGGKDTLHGGYVGTGRSGWRVEEEGVKKNEVKMSLEVGDGIEGFPGAIKIYLTYSLLPSSIFLTTLTANSLTDSTPIMLSSHVYWNLDAYKSTGGGALEHKLMVKADKFVETDGILIPTGTLKSIGAGSPIDFREGKLIGSQIEDTDGLCGTGCVGYDNCFIYENDGTRWEDDVKMVLESESSGIRLTVKTDQPAAQVYSCNGETGQHVRKQSHGKGTYGKHSCVVLEQQGYIDGINNPQWGQKQFYASGETYEWTSEYSFSTF